MLFQINFQLVVRNASTSFSCLPRNIRRKSVPFSYSFFRLCIQELKVLYLTFTRSLVHVVLGTELLQRPFFREGQFSLIEQFFFSGHSGEVYKLTLQSNQTVYIYIDQFIAIKVNSWVLFSL